MRIVLFAFEVMDKEPSPVKLLFTGVFLATLGFYLCRKKPFFAFATIPICFLLLAGPLFELFDHSVGPGMVREAGVIYIAGAIGSLLLGCGGSILGTYENIRRRKNATATSRA